MAKSFNKVTPGANAIPRVLSTSWTNTLTDIVNERTKVDLDPEANRDFVPGNDWGDNSNLVWLINDESGTPTDIPEFTLCKVTGYELTALSYVFDFNIKQPKPGRVALKVQRATTVNCLHPFDGTFVISQAVVKKPLDDGKKLAAPGVIHGLSFLRNYYTNTATPVMYGDGFGVMTDVGGEQKISTCWGGPIKIVHSPGNTSTILVLLNNSTVNVLVFRTPEGGIAQQNYADCELLTNNFYTPANMGIDSGYASTSTYYRVYNMGKTAIEGNKVVQVLPIYGKLVANWEDCTDA